MRHLRARSILVAAALAVAPQAVAQDATIRLRVGEHPGYGRLVFETGSGGAPAYQLDRDGERLRLRFAAPAALDLRAGRRP
ncbi:MAG: hypothetical protein K2X74_01295, partial [Acetobacteraceae bacterium]|nr:hypothetical protein [Acetobacteraceae bacterium]